MIGFLRGILLEKHAEWVILDVNGVGYEVTVPASSICALPSSGETAALYIHTYVREDALRLFGFASRFDRSVFATLLGVQAVGPKAALTLLGPFDGSELCRVIISSDVNSLVKVPGVGAKTAERLVLELKDKVQKMLALHAPEADLLLGAGMVGRDGDVSTKPSGDRLGAIAESRLARHRVIEDLRSALNNLGYKDRQINEVLRDYEECVKRDEDVRLEDALRAILKRLSPKLDRR